MGRCGQAIRLEEEGESREVGKTKLCYKCDETKPLRAFSRDIARKGGRHGMCKVCVKAHYRENREEILASQMAYKIKSKYGLTLSEYDKMLEAQDGRCAICKKTPEEIGRRLSVDHSHETGEIRGLLCNSCNIGVGYLQNSSEACEQAASYLRSHE